MFYDDMNLVTIREVCEEPLSSEYHVCVDNTEEHFMFMKVLEEKVPKFECIVVSYNEIVICLFEIKGDKVVLNKGRRNTCIYSFDLSINSTLLDIWTEVVYNGNSSHKSVRALQNKYMLDILFSSYKINNLYKYLSASYLFTLDDISITVKDDKYGWDSNYILHCIDNKVYIHYISKEHGKEFKLVGTSDGVVKFVGDGDEVLYKFDSLYKEDILGYCKIVENSLLRSPKVKSNKPLSYLDMNLEMLYFNSMLVDIPVIQYHTIKISDSVYKIALYVCNQCTRLYLYDPDDGIYIYFCDLINSFTVKGDTSVILSSSELRWSILEFIEDLLSSRKEELTEQQNFTVPTEILSYFYE